MQLGRPGAILLKPFIIAIVYTTCDASTDCISKPGIFSPGRLILQHAPFYPLHTETSASARSTWVLASWIAPSAVTRAVSYKLDKSVATCMTAFYQHHWEEMPGL